MDDPASGKRTKPKIGPFLDRIAEILAGDRDSPKKQCHTAKRIFEAIRDEGYQGGYTQVKEAVREMKRVCREVFLPLVTGALLDRLTHGVHIIEANRESTQTRKDKATTSKTRHLTGKYHPFPGEEMNTQNTRSDA